MDCGSVLGSLELNGKALLVTVNSATRAVKVTNLLIEAAGQLLKQPLTTIRTVERMMAEGRPARSRGDADEIPPDIAR